MTNRVALKSIQARRATAITSLWPNASHNSHCGWVQQPNICPGVASKTNLTSSCIQFFQKLHRYTFAQEIDHIREVANVNF